MVASAYESLHRLVVAPGEIVLRDTRLVRNRPAWAAWPAEREVPMMV
jgi:hypothetical protein